MADIPDLEDSLLAQKDKFEKRKKLLVFSDLIYKPTEEKVKLTFRYYFCDIEEVVNAFARGEYAALTKLPYALDEDGDRDTSSVLVDLAYTDSGSMVAVQPVEYQNYAPTPVAEAKIVEGEAAKALLPTFRELGD